MSGKRCLQFNNPLSTPCAPQSTPSMTKDECAPIWMRAQVCGESMILGMRFFSRVWLIMLLHPLMITDLNLARTGRAGAGSRLVSATTAGAETGLSTELPAEPQDPRSEERRVGKECR